MFHICFPCALLNLFNHYIYIYIYFFFHIYVLNMLHMFSLACFSTYGSKVVPDMIEVRLLVQFRTVRIQNLVLEAISRWFCMVLRGEAQNWLLVSKRDSKRGFLSG